MTERIQRREVRLKALVDQVVGQTVFSGGKKAGRNWKRMIRELED